VIGLAAFVATCVVPPFGDVHVAVKLLMALPLLAPGVKETMTDPVAEAVFDLALTAVAGAGEPTITGADAAEAGLAPRALVCFTRHV
jgi:hypothetical protein